MNVFRGSEKVKQFHDTSPNSRKTLRTHHTVKTAAQSPHFNSQGRVLILQVQPMNLEWVGFRLTVAWLPSSDETVTRFNKKHTQRRKKRAKRKGLSATSLCTHRYAGMISPSITTDGKCLRWQETCHGAPAPCCSRHN